MSLVYIYRCNELVSLINVVVSALSDTYGMHPNVEYS